MRWGWTAGTRDGKGSTSTRKRVDDVPAAMTTLPPERLTELAHLAAIRQGPAALAYLLDPSYHRMPHTDLISKTIVDANANDYWVMVHTPPQAGKTLTGIVWTAFWLLVDDPTREIIIISYNDDTAVDRGVEVKRLVETYGGLYGLKIKYGLASKKNWSLETGGRVYSVGIFGGLGGRTGTELLIDDYIKQRAEADSAKHRAKLLSEIGASAMSRLAPGGLVVWINTLWHHLEPAQVMKDRYGERTPESPDGKWRVLRLPAFADQKSDPLGRAIGQPLLRYANRLRRPLTVTEAAEWWTGVKRGQNPREWSSLYMANPQAIEGALMEPQQVLDATKPLPGETRLVREVIAVDPADADSLDATGHDSTGIVHVARDSTGTIWVLGDYTMTGPVTSWAKRVVGLAASLDVDEIVYERNKGGAAVGEVIRSTWRSEERAGRVAGPCPRVESVTATKNKVTRASPVASMLCTGEACFAVGADLTDIQDQLTTYQAGSADSPDNMDAMVYGVLRLYKASRSRGIATGGAPQV